jgi:hypothetical protein
LPALFGNQCFATIHRSRAPIKNQAAAAQKMPLPPGNSGLGFFIQQKQATVGRLKSDAEMISALMNFQLSSRSEASKGERV